MGCRERKLKDPCIIHVARIKQILERTVELDKPRGNGKHVRARKAMDSYGSGARTQGSSTTYLYSANTREVDHRSKVRGCVVWWWGEGGAYFGVSS